MAIEFSSYVRKISSDVPSVDRAVTQCDKFYHLRNSVGRLFLFKKDNDQANASGLIILFNKMNDNNTIVFSESEPTDVIQFLEEKIYQHNSSAIGRNDGRFFAKTIRDTENNIVGGISGWFWADACEITLLWIRDDHRNKGYGELLLEAVEQEAQKNNCKIILLKSYDFQAPTFYQKNNYQIELITKDFPPGYSYYCLIKRI